jgi:hypothetical protein
LVTVRRRPAKSSAAWGLASTAAAATFVVSYAGQRLWSLGTPQPDPTEAILLGHTPFYWRCGVALLQAALVASMIGAAVDDDRAAAALRWAPVWLPAIVLPLALLMVAFP